MKPQQQRIMVDFPNEASAGARPPEDAWVQLVRSIKVTVHHQTESNPLGGYEGELIVFKSALMPDKYPTVPVMIGSN